MVEIRKPPNFKVIDEICVGPLALHRRSRLERQDSANCNATSAAAIRNGSFTSLMGQGRKLFGCRRFRVPSFSACSFGT
jgi:hypothetical protein